MYWHAVFVTSGLQGRRNYCSTGEAIKVISEVINISDNEEFVSVSVEQANLWLNCCIPLIDYASCMSWVFGFTVSEQ